MKRLDIAALRAALPRALAINIEYFEAVSSTNDLCKALKVPPLQLLIAERQSAGRGRQGHSFFSPAGGLYFSLGLAVKDVACELSLVSAAAALALARSLEAQGAPELALKWVNDLYLGERKVGGILVESEALGDPQAQLVVGIGLNLEAGTEPFPAELAHKAGYLFRQLPADFSAERCLAGFVTNFLELIADRNGSFIAAYRERLAFCGERVRSKEGEGRFLGVDDRGRAILESAGQLLYKNSGELEFCRFSSSAEWSERPAV